MEMVEEKNKRKNRKHKKKENTQTTLDYYISGILKLMKITMEVILSDAHI